MNGNVKHGWLLRKSIASRSMIGAWHLFSFRNAWFSMIRWCIFVRWATGILCHQAWEVYIDRMCFSASSCESQMLVQYSQHKQFHDVALEKSFAAVGDNMNQKRSIRCKAFPITMTWWSLLWWCMMTTIVCPRNRRGTDQGNINWVKQLLSGRSWTPPRGAVEAAYWKRDKSCKRRYKSTWHSAFSNVKLEKEYIL